MARGKLRIYLGAAPGVGKTFAMLNEGRRRHERGTDVVVGFVETHGRPNTAAQLGDLEVVPRRRSSTAARRSRRWTSTPSSPASPQVALVDELAHTNVPGLAQREALAGHRGAARRRHRRHLDGQHPAPRVAQRRRRAASPASPSARRCPTQVVRAADQIELVDMTPEALRRRMAHGNIYPAETHRRRARQLLPRREPRGAARARAAVGRRPRRRGAPGVPRAPRHRRAVGDAGAGASSRSPARPAATTWSAGRPASRRAPRPSSSACTCAPSDGLAGPSERSARRAPRAARASSAAATTRSPAADVAARARSTRARRERDPARARRAAGARAGPSSRAGSVDQRRHPAVGSHRRARDLPPTEPTTSIASALPRTRRRASPLPRRRPASRLGARRRRARRCSRSCSPACASTSACRSILLLFLLLVVVGAAHRRRWPGAGRRRRRVRCCSTGSSRRRFTRSRSTTARTSLALVVFLVVARSSSSVRRRPSRAPLGRSGRARAPRPRRSRAWPAASCADAIRCPSSSTHLRDAFGLDGRSPCSTATTDGGASRPRAGDDRRPTPDERTTTMPLGDDVVLALARPRARAPRTGTCSTPSRPSSASRSRAAGSRPRPPARPTLGQGRTSCAPRCSAAVSHDLRTPLASIKASVTSPARRGRRRGSPRRARDLLRDDRRGDRPAQPPSSPTCST